MIAQDNVTNSDVISSNRVEGTAVYSNDGNSMGHVKELMIERRSGQVREAILSIGGFLGIGTELHSIPWNKLDYDTSLGGYRLDVTQDQLRDAPRFASEESDRAYDPVYQRQVRDYWAVTPAGAY